MPRSTFYPTSRFSIGVALILGLVLFNSSPFVHALEIHHLFADLDHDGHQHYEFDLCQWIQHHTANFPVWDASHLVLWSVVAGFLLPGREKIGLSLAFPFRHPRGPPGTVSS